MAKWAALVGACVAATVIAGCAPPAAGDLGIEGSFSEATSVSSTGHIVGLRRFAPPTQPAWVREPDGDVIDPFPGKNVYGTVFVTSSGTVVAFTWDVDSPLPPPYVGEVSRRTRDGRITSMTGAPHKVNDQGDVLAGLSVWRADGSIVELSASPDLSGTRGEAINDKGEVFGRIEGDGVRGDRLVRWDADGGELHVLLEMPAYHSMNIADVNDAGEVVGSVSVNGGPSTPVLWRTAGTRVERIDLPGQGHAVAINNRGAIVGHVAGPTNAEAVMWAPITHQVRPLKGAEREALVADISDAGHIVGRGVVADGRTVAVRFTP